MAVITGLAKPDAASTDAADGVWINLTGNDAAGYGALTVTGLDLTGTLGTARLNSSAPNGAWYSPGTAFAYLSLGEQATDTFGYTVTDAAGDTSTAAVSVTVTGVNAAPVAAAQAAFTSAGQPVAINLLAGDSDPNRDDTIALASVNGAATLGTITPEAGAPGIVDYAPGAAFNGLSAGETATDTFSYTITDNHGAPATATATVTVAGVNVPPAANPDRAATDAQHGVWINLTANDTDPNRDDRLAVIAVDRSATKGSPSLVAGSPNGVWYSPNAAFNYLSVGETATDTFAYTISDGHGGTATSTATVTVTGVNLAPVANPDRAATDAQHGVWLGLLNNDFDPNRDDTLTISALGLSATHGSVVRNPTAPNGVWYMPNGAYDYLSAGETATDTLTYTVSDNHGAAATSTAAVTVSGVNLPPVARPQAATTDAQHGLWFNLLAGNTDPNRDDTLSVAGVNLSFTRGTVTSNPTSPNGVWYSPGAAFSYLSAGETATDTFGYTITDNHGAAATSTVAVTVTGVNLPPVAKPDAALTDSQHGVSFDVLANDTDPNKDDTISVLSLNLAGTIGSVQLVPGTSGEVTYSPGTAFNYLGAGQIATDRFAYTITDNHGATATATATVTVIGVNLPPVANPDLAATDAQHGVWVNLTGNDVAINRNDALAVSGLDLSLTHGSAALNPASPSGAWYSPGGAFAYLGAGETATDTFGYTITDSHGLTAAASATVTVTGVNLPPAARAATATTDAQDPVRIGLAADVSDPNRDDTLSVTAVNGTGTLGSVALDPQSPTGVIYSPGSAFDYLSAGETATDRFGYTVSDNHGASASSTVTVTVTGVNLPPVAAPFTATTDADHGLWLNLQSDWSDPNRHDVVAITAVNAQGTKGVVTLNPEQGGGVWYSPGQAFQNLAPGQSATDSFTYTVADGHGGVATGTATVDVVASGSLAVPGRAFFVTANGNDSWSGRLAQPNAAGTDGPFATFNAARLAMENDLTTQTTYVEGGDYYLNAPLGLTLKDSGQTWSAYNGQTVNIHAGTKLTGWTNQGNGLWTIRPPAGAMAGGGAVDTLYVNGVAQTDVRFPDVAPGSTGGGWLTAAAGQPGDNPATQFHFAPGSLPSFASTAGLYAVVFAQNGWSDVVSPVSAIDYGTDTVTLANPSPYALGGDSRFYLFNTGATPTTPGTYSFDPASGVLTYDAPAGFDGTGASVGTQSLGIGIYGAHDITLSGLTIGDGQSGGYGVQVSGSSNITVQGDKVDNTGTGILVDNGSSNIHLLGNELANLNAYGILLTTSANTVTADGNSIHDVGALTSGDGIWFTGSSNDVFSDNVIRNVAKVGIGGGSLLGRSDASYNDVITRNTITGANQQTADAGAIYLIGRQQDATGDVVSFNTVSDTSALNPLLPGVPSAGIGAGIYLDDFASGVTVHGNLLEGNVDGVWVHLGSDNTIDGNVIASTLNSALVLDGANATGIAALQPPTGNAFVGNTTFLDHPGSIAGLIVDALGGASWSGDVLGGPALGAQPFHVDLGGGTAQDTWAQWQALGFDAGAPAPSASLSLAAALASLPAS